jgi:hypothetical protein
MRLGDVIHVSGCFTKEKYIAGRTLVEIERNLGFRAGRLAHGMTVVTLLELPSITEFGLAAYSNVPTHRFVTPSNPNIDKLKANARASWALVGFERLVRVLPAARHNPAVAADIQYPPGQGVPQWIARRPLCGRVVAILTEYPNARYVAASVAGRG